MNQKRVFSQSMSCAVLAIFLILVTRGSLAQSEDIASPVQLSPALDATFEVGSVLNFVWAEYPNAIDYDMFVYSLDNREIVHRESNVDLSECVNGECAISVVSTTNIVAGKFDWRIAARTPQGRTSFSRLGFEITNMGPSVPVLVSPSNNMVFNRTDEVVLSWEVSPDAESYSLDVYNKSIGQTEFRLSLFPADDCLLTQCSLSLPADATANFGNHIWRVAARNELGVKSSYAGAEFAVHPVTPAEPSPIAPLESIVLGDYDDLSISWEHVEGVEAYDLLLWSRETANIDYRQRKIDPVSSCISGVCEHNVPRTSLPSLTGDYVWRVASKSGQARSSFSHTQFSLKSRSAPNIVYLMADDLGYADLNATDMPRSYALAQAIGIELPFFTYQNCAPTRTALMTGNRASRLNITGVDPPPSYRGVPVEQVMISERLQAAGYQTGVFGKWHLGLELNQSPLFNGFDEFVGFSHGWINYYGMAPDGMPYPDGTLGHDHHSAHDFQRSGAPSYEAEYSTFIFRDAAIDFINRSSENPSPYFLYVPFNAPHGPFSAPKEYVLPLQERFDVTDGQMNLLYEYAKGVLGKPVGLKQPDGSDYSFSLHRKLDLLLYFAAVRALDDAVADILEAVIAIGDIDNTFFMFASDNGASPSRGGFGSNAPFSKGKGSFFNGGHRVANFAVFPKKYGIEGPLMPNVWVGDLYETFAQIAKLPPPTNSISGLDSTGLLPAWLGNQAFPPRESGSNVSGTHFVLHEAKRYDSRFDDEIIYEWAAIDGNFKYVRAGTISTQNELLTSEEYLFDFVSDVPEINNLIGLPGMSQITEKMRNTFYEEGGDDMILGWHTTDKSANWSNFVPEEWGFPID